MKKIKTIFLLGCATFFMTACSVDVSVKQDKEGEKVEVIEVESSKKTYVILNLDNGDMIKAESNKVSWSEDGVDGTTQNYYMKDNFKLKFTDLKDRIVADMTMLNGQDFPVIISYNDQDYNAIAVIKNSIKGDENDYLGTEYILKGVINSFEMGSDKVTNGTFAFNTFVKGE